MTAKTKTPRTAIFMGMVSPPQLLEKGTWLEAESFCYPNGGMKRRAMAMAPDGALRLVYCGIPDTFFTIPVRGGGFLTVDEGVLRYHPPTPIADPSSAC